jgi:peptide methionine sulfoxide reductase MsrB
MLNLSRLLIFLSVSVSGFRSNEAGRRRTISIQAYPDDLDVTTRRDHISRVVSSILGVSMSFTTRKIQPVDAISVGGKPVFGAETIMVQKEHGTSSSPVQQDLLFGVSNKLADRICNYNRHFAEMGGYFRSTSFTDVVLKAQGQPITFYDSVTGKPLFIAPIDRSVDDFITESEIHGWPSFRDSEVVWDNVRILKDGETVSVDGTHLGHNLPDRKGNRYCINLVSIAGQPIMS